MLYDYTNLVFEGGGVKGIAYAGALEVLSERNILSNIKKAAGTSAGAVTACLVCLDYNLDGLQVQPDVSTRNAGMPL